jgi:hypothetical protein
VNICRSHSPGRRDSRIWPGGPGRRGPRSRQRLTFLTLRGNRLGRLFAKRKARNIFGFIRRLLWRLEALLLLEGSRPPESSGILLGSIHLALGTTFCCWYMYFYDLRVLVHKVGCRRSKCGGIQGTQRTLESTDSTRSSKSFFVSAPLGR